MSYSVQMPALGESVTEGTVTRWLKQEGDQVTEDEPLLEVSTDKVDTEVPAPRSGVLTKILVQEDETVDVGAELAVIDEVGAASSGGGPTGNDGAADTVDTAGGADGAQSAIADDARQAEDTNADQSAQLTDVDVAPQAPAGEGAAGVAEVPAEEVDSSQTAADASDATTVVMPEMGESVTEGVVTRWLKQVGDAIAMDEPIVEIATDKVDAEVPSPVAGVLLQVLAAEDDTVEVGAPLALVGAAGAQSTVPTAQTQPEQTRPAQATPAQAQPEQPAPQHTSQPEPSQPVAQARPAPQSPQTAGRPAAATPAAPVGSSGRRGYVTPVVRKLAADRGVDLDSITGTGVGGRIRREDVLAAAAAASAAQDDTTGPAAASAATRPGAAHAGAAQQPAAPSPLVGTTQQAPRIRQAIARSMMHAVTTSAQTTTIIEVDATRVAALRDRAQESFQKSVGTELTLLPFFVQAALEATKSHPVINASLSDDFTEITYHANVHLAIAVDTDRGQISPVIRNADTLGLAALARHISDLTARSGTGELGPDELSGATLTASNVGSPGTLIDTPIVVPPQAASLALGSVNKRPVVVSSRDGEDVIAVRSIATVALSFDQRFVDGSDAAKYLAAVKQRIEDGAFDTDLSR